jgi:NAD(P)-dependent dehydrogenase (short-subunit alcohol dehydrogenase family)
MARFDGQVAIVTGGARGIGRGIAKRLGSEGARLLMVDVSEPRGEDAVSELAAEGIDVRLEVGDVAEPDTAERAVEHAVASWGRVDILVNNAGIAGISGNIWDQPVEQMDLVYRTNLRGVFVFCQKVIPHMLERDYGRIVNIASVAGKEGNPGMVPYSATKAAVIGLTKSVGKELATTGIRVNCVTPAVVMTPLLESVAEEHVQYMVEKVPMGRPGEIEEIAALVAWLASEECSFSTGAVFDISGGRATY